MNTNDLDDSVVADFLARLPSVRDQLNNEMFLTGNGPTLNKPQSHLRLVVKDGKITTLNTYHLLV